MAKMQEFKCPCCGGSIEFDSSAQKMKCPFCDTEFDVKTLSEHAKAVEEEQPEDMNWSDEAGSEWQDGESEGLRTYTSPAAEKSLPMKAQVLLPAHSAAIR